MKKLWLLSLIIFFTIIEQNNAQIRTSKECSYKVSTPYKVVDAPNKLYFNKGKDVMAVKITGKEITIQKFDANSPKETGRTVFKNMPKDFSFETIVEMKDNYYLFFEIWDKPNQTEQLFYYKIDFDKGEIIGKEKRLFTVKDHIAFYSGVGFTGFSFYAGASGAKFSYEKSFDENKLLIQYRKKPEKKKDINNYDEIGMYVFDENLNKDWGKEVTMPFTERRMDNLDYAVDKNGSVFLLTVVYHDNSNRKRAKDGSINYHIELLTIDGDRKITKSKIKAEGKFLNEAWLFENPKGFMTCAGFYSKNGKTTDSADGIYMFKANPDGKTYDHASYEIPLEIMNMYRSEKDQAKSKKKSKKKDVEFANLVLTELINQDDGSIVLVGERQYQVTYTNSKGRTRTIYHYNYMLVTKIDANGKLAWMKKLPKAQNGGLPKGGMGYKYMNQEGHHYLVFLDNVKNIKLNTNQRPAMHMDGRGGFMTAYKINDSDGNVNKLSVLDFREAKVKGKETIVLYQFTTDRIQITEEGEFVFEVYKKDKEDVMVKVTIE